MNISRDREKDFHKSEDDSSHDHVEFACSDADNDSNVIVNAHRHHHHHHHVGGSDGGLFGSVVGSSLVVAAANVGRVSLLNHVYICI